jgi:DNA polymerase
MRTLTVDIETYSSVELPRSGVYPYCASPDFRILLFAYAHDDEVVEVVDLASGEAIPHHVVQALSDPNILKTAYNASFERVCLSAWLKTNLPADQWRCTMVHAATLGLPASLDAVGSALGLDDDHKKLATGRTLIRYFCLPCEPTARNGGRMRNLPMHDPARWALFIEYCARDVEAERAIRHRLETYPVPESENALYALDQKINDTGVRVDIPMVQQAIRCDGAYRARLEKEAFELTGLDNVKAVGQLKSWLESEDGTAVTSLTKESLPTLIANASSETIRRVLEIRQELSRTSISKYAAMGRAVCADGRIRGLLQFYGARTGRWCLAEGTPVLVKRSDGRILEVAIEDVAINDTVWDGNGWVTHDGVVFSGDKDVITWDGITATPEHIVYLSDRESMPLREAKRKGLPLWKGNSPSTV